MADKYLQVIGRWGQKLILDLAYKRSAPLSLLCLCIIPPSISLSVSDHIGDFVQQYEGSECDRAKLSRCKCLTPPSHLHTHFGTGWRHSAVISVFPVLGLSHTHTGAVESHSVRRPPASHMHVCCDRTRWHTLIFPSHPQSVCVREREVWVVLLPQGQRSKIPIREDV